MYKHNIRCKQGLEIEANVHSSMDMISTPKQLVNCV